MGELMCPGLPYEPLNQRPTLDLLPDFKEYQFSVVSDSRLQTKSHVTSESYTWNAYTWQEHPGGRCVSGSPLCGVL